MGITREQGLNEDAIRGLGLITKQSKELIGVSTSKKRVEAINRVQKGATELLNGYVVGLRDTSDIVTGLLGLSEDTVKESIELIERKIAPIGMLSPKLSEQLKGNPSKQKEVIEVVKGVINGNIERLENEGVLKEILQGIDKGAIEDKVYRDKEISERIEKELQGIHRANGVVKSAMEDVYDLLDKRTDEISQIRIGRVKELLKQAPYNKGIGVRVGVVKVKDREGISVTIRGGTKYYISTKGIYRHTKEGDKVEVLIKYEGEEVEGLLDWWFSKQGAYAKYVGHITKIPGINLTKEEKVGLSRLGDILNIGYDRRISLNVGTITKYERKYEGIIW